MPHEETSSVKLRDIFTHFKYSAVIWPCNANHNENAGKKQIVREARHHSGEYFAWKKKKMNMMANKTKKEEGNWKERETGRHDGNENQSTTDSRQLLIISNTADD